MTEMKVVVIGNGIGGFSAASTMRRLESQYDITMISTEKTPLYSACVLPDYISGKITRERTFVKRETDYRDLNIHTLFGHELEEIDAHSRKVIINNGKAITFDRLIVATGSEAIGLGEPKRGVFKVKSLKDADEIIAHKGSKAVVVGSGAIGIELAIALYHRGHEVTIVEMMDQILPLALDRKAAARVKGILGEHGIRILNSERAESVLGHDRVEGLRTDNQELECDTLICALGMRPKVELASEAGIKIGEKGGIKVDSHMETNIPDIYACGDCVEASDILTGEPSLNLFWNNANRQGAVAGRNCTGHTTEYPGSRNILNVDIFGNHVVGFGYTASALEKFSDKKAVDGQAHVASILEGEKDGGYYRLVILGDRCMGGQFINMKKDLGLIWALMCSGKSIEELLRAFENDELMRRRPYLFRLRPFFM
ncbi:MAG: NAD(P)/FAD-dependent oxidoreductase [Deltaproteobacteria bacterium]|nr:MAG: NAD(P)/FAD-dependent oxidoreductase [Deltaproteobacteria bacterium]